MNDHTSVLREYLLVEIITPWWNLSRSNKVCVEHQNLIIHINGQRPI
jgi:hypothetical protein